MNGSNQHGHRLSRSSRLRRQADFDRVYRNKAYAADNTLVVQGCDNELGYCRLGLSVSRRVGNAVVRNRWKRLIREAFRLQRAKLPASLDLVVRPRRDAQMSFKAIHDALPRLAQSVERRLRQSAS